MKQKPPISAETPTGAKNRTAEAVQVPQPQYPAFGCEPQQEIHDDVPQLPDRSQEVWKAPQRSTTLPLRSMPQDLHGVPRNAAGRHVHAARASCRERV